MDNTKAEIRYFQYRRNAFVKTKNEILPCQYTSIGMYDGIETGVIENVNFDSIRQKNEELIIASSGKGYKFEMVYGIREKEDDESKNIWEENTVLPFLFTTFMQIECKNNNYGKIAKDIEIELHKKGSKAACYYTLDDCSLLLVIKDSSYSNAMRCIKNVCSHNNIDKGGYNCIYSYTVFSILKEYYQNKDKYNVCDENIEFELRGIVKDNTLVRAFLDEKMIFSNACDYKCNDVFGTEDVCINFKNVKLCEFIEMYKDNNILTHSNTDYCNTFYGITTVVTCGEDNSGLSIRGETE